MKSKSIRWFVAAAMMITGLGRALAATWDGGPSPHTGTSWNDPVNWVGDVKPGADDTAAFSANKNTGLTSGKVISLGAPQSIHKLEIPSWAQAPNFTIGNAADVTAGNTLTLAYAYLGPNYNNDVTITANVILGDDSIWDTTEDAFIINGAVSGDGRGFAKWGANAISLRGLNTYTGSTVLNVGTLRLDFGGPASPATDIVDPSSPLVLNGGLLAVKAKSSSSSSQNFDVATANTGASSINLESASGANVRLSFGDLVRTTGATLNLKQPTGNTAISASNGYTTPEANDASGILGAYLTVMPQDGTAPADWAMNNGVNVVAFDNYATLSGETAIIANNATSNVQIDSATTGTVTLASSNIAINSLKVSDTTARLLDLGGGTLRLGASGGILTPSSTGALTLTNGTLTAGGADNTAGEIVVVNATAIMSSAIVANNGAGAVALTKSGGGTLQLTTAQAHTGGTFVNAGTLQLPAITDPLSPNSDIVVNGGTLNLGASTQNLSSNFVMRGGTLSNGTIMKSDSDYKVDAGTVSATLGGSSGLVKTSPAAATFTGANTYTGDTHVLEGAARFEKTSAIVKGNLFVGSPNGTFPASVYCVNTPLNSGKTWTVYKNGRLDSGTSAQYLSSKLSLVGGTFTGGQPYFQSGSTVEMLGGNFGGTIYGSGAFDITSLSNDVPAVVSASLRNNNHKFIVNRGSGPIDLLFTGTMTGTGTQTLTKEGNGVMVMNGSGHNNGTVLNAGTLLVANTSGSGTGSGAVTVKAGSTLGGTGFIGGVSGYTSANVSVAGASGNPAVVAPGTVDPVTGDHVIGTLTVGSGAQANNVTFGANSALKIGFDTNGNCDKLAVNGTLSLDAATDKLVLDIADYAALKAGTYTLATFTALATPGTVFDVVEKPTSGTLQYTATSIEYVVHPKTTVLVVK